MRIVSRAEWGAAPPLNQRKVYRIPLPTPRLWLHHTTGNFNGAHGMRSLQRFHQRTKGWNDIAYSFLVDDDGTVYEGRGAGIAGAHTEGDNSKSHGISLMGDYSSFAPPDAQIAAVAELIRHGHQQGWWPPHLTGGHRDAPDAQTACPGNRAYALIPTINQRAAHTSPEEDELSPEERQMLERIHHHIVSDKGRLYRVTAAGDQILELCKRIAHKLGA